MGYGKPSPDQSTWDSKFTVKSVGIVPCFTLHMQPRTGGVIHRFDERA